jgi:hypothetical protein
MTTERDIRNQIAYAEEKGMEKGMEKGESKFADLTGKLLSAGRIEDVKKASADPIYRKKLYEELQIQ